jgi:hypothetical protein
MARGQARGDEAAEARGGARGDGEDAMMSENTPKTDKRRAPKTAWKKGDPSPNPGGRPKASEAQRLAKDAKAQAQPAAIKFFVDTMSDPNVEMRDRIACAKALAEGLEAVKLEVDATIKGEVTETVKLAPIDPARLARIAGVLQQAGVLAALEAKGEEPK